MEVNPILMKYICFEVFYKATAIVLGKKGVDDKSTFDIHWFKRKVCHLKSAPPFL